MPTQIFQAKGLHCRSCEILIKDRLHDELKADNVEISHKTGLLSFSTEKKIDAEKLNNLFKDDGYNFSKDKKQQTQNTNSITLISIVTAVIIGGLFLVLSKLGLASGFQVSASTALGGFLLFGLLAGSSTCAALVGGLVLSMTKRWSQISSSALTVNLLFNIGRILSYALFGYILGSLGSMFQFSAYVTFLLTLVVVIVMVALGLNMLGIGLLNNLIPNIPALKNIPKNLTKLGPLEPLALGTTTLFLPCGFTFAVQTAAVASKDPIKGMLMMGIFAIGTLPVLLTIGLSSKKAVTNPHISAIANKTAGFLVIIFAFQMINSQLNSIGIGGINTFIPTLNDTSQITKVNGQQVIDVSVYADHFEPTVINLQAGVPTVFNITDKGMTGCTAAVKAPGLFNETLNLTPKGTISKSFIPVKAGKYVLSCWMGMVTSTINVVESNSQVQSVDNEMFAVEAKTQTDNSNGCSCNGGCRGSTAGCSMDIK